MSLGTPYITPPMLQRFPTGVAWSLIPWPKATDADQLAAQTDMCWRATSIIDSYVRQVLRATADTEYLNGPGQPRCNVDPDTGNGVLQMRRWPVTDVLAIQVSPARSFPRVWTPVTAGQWDIRHPLIYSGDSASATAPDGGWTIDVAPGWISWCSSYPSGTRTSGYFTGGGGRGSQRVQVSYINGWPHTSLTATASRGATVLNVDDVTGWAGASGFAYDGSATEQLSAASVSATSPFALPNNAGTAQAGPGTITLSSALAYEHQEGTVISALPAAVLQAAALCATVQALNAGIDSIAIQQLNGTEQSSGSGTESLSTEYELLLDNFRRVI